MKTHLGLGSWAVLATLVVHGGLAVALTTLHEDKPQPPTEITLREVPPKKAPTPPPPPPPPAPAPPQPQAAPRPAPPAPRPAPARRPPPAPTAAAPTAAPAAAPVDLGLRLGNSGGNGPAVGAPAAAAADLPPPPPPKAKQLTPQAAPAGGCSDPIVKPKPTHVVQPAFTQDALDAGITGKVRVEITISATGTVTAARVLEGLGHGLDEAALDAAKQSTFTPATRCGEPVETTLTIGMRFQH